MTEKEERLIHKFLDKTLSEEDWKTLLDWLENPENKKVFNTYVKAEYLLHMSFEEKGRNLTYDTLLELMDENPHQGTPKLWSNQKWWAVAASIVILVGLALGTYYWVGPSDNGAPELVKKITIEQGTDGATLTLEDGTKVELKKGSSYKNSYATSNGEEVVYADDESKFDELYNTITVARGKQFAMTLSDGTKVWLNSDSKLKYPVSFHPGNTRVVELIYGEAYFDVSPATENQGSAFQVQQEHQKVTVLGTEFNIKAYANETLLLTTLVEGKVAVTYQDSKTMLEPSDQSVVDMELGKIETRQVDVLAETSWRRGLFLFKNKTLEEIATTLSRWYDIDIEIKDRAVGKVEFKGTLSKDQPLEVILELIKNTKFIKNYDIEEDKVVIW